jgi:hypothetical protein
MTSDDKNPKDQALDLFVYAPLGLAYEAKDLLPKLAKRGKGQADLLRVAGEYALKNAQGDIEGFLRSAVTAAGLTPDESDVPESDTGGESPPLPNYDDLIASDIVKLLESLEVEQVLAVRAYEQAGRGRVTVLNKIKRLTGE